MPIPADTQRAIRALDQLLDGDGLAATVSRGIAAAGTDPTGRALDDLQLALVRLTQRVSERGRAIEAVAAAKITHDDEDLDDEDFDHDPAA